MEYRQKLKGHDPGTSSVKPTSDPLRRPPQALADPEVRRRGDDTTGSPGQARSACPRRYQPHAERLPTVPRGAHARGGRGRATHLPPRPREAAGAAAAPPQAARARLWRHFRSGGVGQAEAPQVRTRLAAAWLPSNAEGGVGPPGELHLGLWLLCCGSAVVGALSLFRSFSVCWPTLPFPEVPILVVGPVFFSVGCVFVLFPSAQEC